jgi:hypothetical protein
MQSVVLSPRYTDDSRAIREAALRRGWRVLRLPDWRAPEDLEVDDAVVYGEPLFVAAVAETLTLAALEAPFDWLSKLPAEYLKRDVRFGDLTEARMMTGPRFVKPADDKCFKARVYQNAGELPAADGLPARTPVLIAEPVTWHVEFRAFVLERTVHAISPYLRNSQLARGEDGAWPCSGEEIEQATSFLTQLLRDDRVGLPPGAVVDVGTIAGRGWATVESNPAWGSGIYGCDPDKVLDVIRAAQRPRSRLRDEDRRWLPIRSL